MDRTESFFAFLRDARIVPHAAGNLPVWLWSADGGQILFANAVGAAIFGGDNVAAVLEKRFESAQIAATAIARLNPTLKHGAAPRLEKLRGFGASFGRALLCQCSRVSLGAHSGVLVIAAEPAGPNLSFNERVRRLIDGMDMPLAAFSADGTLIHANENAAPLLAGRTTLNELRGSGDAVDRDHRRRRQCFHARALRAGQACARSRAGPETVDLTPIAQAMAKDVRRVADSRRPTSSEASDRSTAAGQRTRATSRPTSV